MKAGRNATRRGEHPMPAPDSQAVNKQEDAAVAALGVMIDERRAPRLGPNGPDSQPPGQGGRSASRVRSKRSPSHCS